MTTLAQFKLLAAALLLGVCMYLVYDYTTLRGRNDELSARVSKTEADLAEYKRGTDEAAKQYVLRKEFDQALRKNRQAITTKLETAASEDPATAAYLHERIPDGVRAPFID